MKTVPSQFQGWFAELDNGDLVLENPKPDGKSSWQKLIDRIFIEGVRVKVFGLRLDGYVIYAMASKMCDGFYQNVMKQKSPKKSEQDVIRRGIGSVIGDKIYIIWAGSDGNILMDVRQLEKERSHTTLRDSV